jgi:drug/metabolite transporter (DMT)-like permease
MRFQRIAAYAAIYLVWGGSYLAVRVLVHAMPPVLAAGLRYSLAALLLLPVMLWKSSSFPHWKQIMHALWTGALMLGFGYGVVFWAEKRLSSWIAAVLISTTFLWTYLGESLVLRSTRFRLQMLLPMLLGLGGIPLLVGMNFSNTRISIPAVVCVLLGSIAWTCGSLAAKRFTMPDSHVQTTFLQLVAGGAILLIVSSFHEKLPTEAILGWRPLLALAYLVLAGSMLGMVVYHWLLENEPASQVASFAYVNPVVAMFLGILVAREHSSLWQLAGAGTILASIVLLWAMQVRNSTAPAEPADCTSG